jgi:hypothetical protein
MAADVADPARDAVLSATRSQRSLSVSGLRARLDVRSEPSGGSGHATLVLKATPRNAWGVASGTKAHTIRPKRGGVLRLDDGRFVSGPVRHPGTRRRPLFRNATRVSQSTIRSAADRSARKNSPFR